MNDKPMIRIILIVSYLLSKQVNNLLSELTIPLAFWQFARRGLLNFNTFSAKIFGRPKLDNDRMEIFIFYLPPSLEQSFYQRAIHDLDLTSPGRGSIFSQTIHCYMPQELDYQSIKFEDHDAERLLSSKTHGITLITGRGEADSISYEVMRNGYTAPNIIFGMGMGTRNKLGLLRVTIPQEKEILSLLTYYQDVPVLLNILRQTARLDLPGKGFLYHYPINFARIDTKTQAQMDFHTASTDQIIAAIDTLMHNTDWRRKSSGYVPASYQEDLSKHSEISCVHIYVPYGSEDKITELAFQFGVTGATMSYYRSIQYQDGKMIPDKDYNVYTMVMHFSIVEPLLQHLYAQSGTDIPLVDSYRITIA